MPKILVIEDETILREEVAEWLTLEDYEAITAENGMAGLEAAFRLRPDLIACDITMPLLDGYGVLLELNTNPATADIPFIFVTARAAHEDMRRGMDLGLTIISPSPSAGWNC
jgi:CheY-like chemotaxis protein